MQKVDQWSLVSLLATTRVVGNELYYVYHPCYSQLKHGSMSFDSRTYGPHVVVDFFFTCSSRGEVIENPT